MSFPTSSDLLPPEIDLLRRRWRLPAERVDDVKALLDEQARGGTAGLLPSTSPTTPASWGCAVQLASTAIEGDLPAPTPLVLQHIRDTAYIQSWRFFQAEHTIAHHLLARAARPAPALTRPSADLLASLGTDKINPLQAQAIDCALNHSLALITGGPGTGKTHTLARLLALLLAAHPVGKPPIIRLAAPTGKAAERMKEAIESAADHLPATLPPDTQVRLKAAAATACTLHKLLGFHPGTGVCRHHAKSPLHCDVLIIDECSMVDTLQWRALLTALPATARLILLGDPNQLESVSAGDVLGSLVRQARSHPQSPLAGTWVELTDSIRFRAHPAIGALAEAVVNLQADAAIHLLTTHRLNNPDAPLPADGLNWLGDHGGHFAWSSLPSPVQAALAAVADAPSPSEALAALSRVRLLAAHRENTVGVAGLNASIERHLLSRSDANRAPSQSPKINRPIIINRNDPETGLTNGSVGIIMPDTDGVNTAFFPGDSATAALRRVSCGQLPDHSAAWAMTIHRSQGSEFEQIVVILPSDESPLATRELIYTAITRAKSCVHVCGAESAVRKALTNSAIRCTLLESALTAAEYEPKNVLGRSS